MNPITEPATDIISRLIDHVTSECSSIDVESGYDDWLDELFDLSSVGGPFSHMSASCVLKEVDPVAYRCGMSDYTSSLGEDRGLVEIGDDYYDARKVSDAQDEFVSELESLVTEREEEIEELETEDEERTDDEGEPAPPENEDEIKAKRAEIEALNADIQKCQRYTF